MDDDGDLRELTIAYATLLEGVDTLAIPDLPRAEILVLVQGEGPVTREFPTNTRVIRVPGRGVTRSRNASIDHATRRFLLFCDDDVGVVTEGIAHGVGLLHRTGAALVLGRGITPTGDVRKSYGPEGARLNLFNTARVGTTEMLVDVAQVRAQSLRFDERFGAGAENYLGDEYIFVADLVRSGLAGVATQANFSFTNPTVRGTGGGRRRIDECARSSSTVSGDGGHRRFGPLSRGADGMNWACGEP